MSASSNCVTCGIITQLRARLAPEIFLMRDSGVVSIGAEFREVRRRPRQQVRAHRRRRRCRRATRPARRASERFTNACTSSFEDAALRPAARDAREVDAELARELAHRRRCVRAAGRSRPDPTVRRRQLRRCLSRSRQAAGDEGAGRSRDRRRRAIGVGRMRRRRRAACGFRACLRRLQRQQRRALADTFADGYAHAFDDAADRRRHVHRRLVGFERHQRIVRP